MSDEDTTLSKCCQEWLINDLDPEKSYYWSEVAEAPLFCCGCGLPEEKTKGKTK
jgi:hypothetical protein